MNKAIRKEFTAHLKNLRRREIMQSGPSSDRQT